MVKTTLTASALATLLLLCSSASAQQGQLQPGEDAVPARPGDGPDQQNAADTGFYRASELIGTTVRGEGGQELGTIDDLLIDRRSQRISHFILSDETAARTNPADPNARPSVTQNSVRVVPWSVAQPQFQGEQRAITVPIAPQRFREAPAYTWQEIQAGPRGGWYNDVNTFYGVQPRPGRRGGIEVERDGDVEIDGRQPGRRGRIEVEND